MKMIGFGLKREEMLQSYSRFLLLDEIIDRIVSLKRGLQERIY